MARHTTSRLKAHDAAFPVRIKILIPSKGIGRSYIAMFEWLDREVGRGNYANTGALTNVGEAMALHFVTTREADAFVAAFPELELADGRHRLAIGNQLT